MKTKFTIIVFVFSLLLISSCSKTINYEEEKSYIKKEKSITYYKGSPFTGILNRKGDNLILGSQRTFNEGVLVKDITYFPDKNIKEIKNFNTNGKIDGEHISYFKNGHIKSKRNYKDGKQNGRTSLYFENGQIEKDLNFKDGELDGENISYFKNGKIKSKSNFKDGELDGKNITYFENGQIEKDLNFKDGKFDGENILYFENGKIKEKSNFKDGKQNL